MFEVTKPEIANKTFRIPKELLDRLSGVAQEKGVSLNRLVVQCCEYALNNLRNEDHKQKE